MRAGPCKYLRVGWWESIISNKEKYHVKALRWQRAWHRWRKNSLGRLRGGVRSREGPKQVSLVRDPGLYWVWWEVLEGWEQRHNLIAQNVGKIRVEPGRPFRKQCHLKVLKSSFSKCLIRERIVYNAFQIDGPGPEWAEQGLGVERRKHLELPWWWD